MIFLLFKLVVALVLPAGFFVMETGVGEDFKTPNLGFCVGSKGTRDEPSGLTSRLLSVFLNSVTTQKKKTLGVQC